MQLRKRLWFLVMPMVLVAPTVAGAAPPPSRGVLHLKQGTVEMATTADFPALARQVAGQQRRYVLQLFGPMNAIQRARLEGAGVVIGDYLPESAYIVRLDEVDAPSLADLDFVRTIVAFRREWKLDPELGHTPPAGAARRQLAREGKYQVVVTLFDGEEAGDALVARVEEAGGTVLAQTRAGDQWLFDVTIPQARVGRLADMDAVQFIEQAPEGTLRNDTNEWILQSNMVSQTPVWDAGIHGEGQFGGLIDGTIREAHCAFNDDTPGVNPGDPNHRKIIGWRNPSTLDAHGTHTAGTFAGDKSPHGSADQHDGIAFAAKISFSNVFPIFSSPSTLYARLQDAHNDGARVHSNSWGDDSTTAYTTWSRQIDQFSYDFEESLVAFAITNLSALKTPENAKNVLAVGASRDTPSQSSHCSGGAGPTADGRRKPEIYAPGCGTLSASGTSCSVGSMTGTSMACPAISGAGLLVRQYFTDGFYPTGLPENDPLIPSGALIKALLINSAVDMTGVSGYPSNREGWGRLLLDNGLFFPGDVARLRVVDVRNADGLSTNDERILSFQVDSVDAPPLRITLAYTEPPASINASDPVINNLDLVVTAPNSKVFFGNRFSGGQSATGGSPDTENNVERVVFQNPDPGIYNVAVRATTVNQGPQGYALVITGDLLSDCNGNGIEDTQEVIDGLAGDCNGNLIPDDCESQADCNGNASLDICDIADGSSPDVDGNGVPDECEPATPITPPAPHDVAKNRYLSFSPNGGPQVAALQVEMTSSLFFSGSTGVVGWVGEPVEPGCPTACSGDFVSRIVATAVFRVWSEPVVHVGDCRVVPAASYDIRATLNGSIFSAPLTIPTVPKPAVAAWADCVGPLIEGVGWSEPDGATNFNDIQAALQVFQQHGLPPHATRMDIHGAELPAEAGGAAMSPPNFVVNFADIQFMVLAFQGTPYPFSDPADCPTNLVPLTGAGRQLRE